MYLLLLHSCSNFAHGNVEELGVFKHFFKHLMTETFNCKIYVDGVKHISSTNLMRRGLVCHLVSRGVTLFSSRTTSPSQQPRRMRKV